MEPRETPQLLSRLNEIVERSRRLRDKKIGLSNDQRPQDNMPVYREGVGTAHKRKAAGGR